MAYYTTVNDGAAAAHFQHQDWLGTERMRTTYNGGVDGSFQSLPFGDGYSATGADTDANHYAMLDHDYESDTEHAEFRQYSSAQGHWLSPDPYDGSYDTSNPQSFNRYSYALNNPLGFVDPTGLDVICSDILDDQGNVIETDCYDDGNGDGTNGGPNCNSDDAVCVSADPPPDPDPITIPVPPIPGNAPNNPGPPQLQDCTAAAKAAAIDTVKSNFNFDFAGVAGTTAGAMIMRGATLSKVANATGEGIVYTATWTTMSAATQAGMTSFVCSIQNMQTALNWFSTLGK